MALARWVSLGLDESVGRSLLDRWSEPHRRYHDLAHLAAVLSGVDLLAEHADDPDLVRLAAWYHDAVYRGSPDDEEQSALLAEAELPAAGLDAAAVAEVARLVRLTAGHRTSPGDRNGEVLCDADLAILASDGYDAYVAAVREEYRHVPEEAFRVGRAAVLRNLLALPNLYRTPLARERWEAVARKNLRSELEARSSLL
ncbi:HD domain-containing protein [Actinokineospora cianjurensis]|uniref:Putative metal-dependent HD superfamily phosphohydrolase n=1 Tax=Actinokineospora cianjurensis TaxID=585224 RepID=A0A421B5L0_9PSEU|nr:metal-dependent phosphohydrolase [Actinokineospora cianjurensis]RLK59530.1 putative metal-dependent HD superfamily phosphohydrolase [Actinokineospora cianjurensis]